MTGAAMGTVVLIADSDVRCRTRLRHFLSKRGFLVIGTADGLGCLEQLVGMQPDVLVMAWDIPWGGGDGVIARLNDGLPIGKRPIVLVFGDAPPRTLSARTGAALDNCFSTPIRKGQLLDRLDRELAVRRHGAERGVCTCGENR